MVDSDGRCSRANRGSCWAISMARKRRADRCDASVRGGLVTLEREPERGALRPVVSQRSCSMFAAIIGSSWVCFGQLHVPERRVAHSMPRAGRSFGRVRALKLRMQSLELRMRALERVEPRRLCRHELLEAVEAVRHARMDAQRCAPRGVLHGEASEPIPLVRVGRSQRQAIEPVCD